MIRTSLALILVLSIVGCNSGGAASANAGADSSAVSMKAPEQTKVGTVTLEEASTNAGIKAYPGAVTSSGNVIDRGNGELKDEVTFTTSDSVDKVTAFYKEQGLDAKSGPVAGSAMGMTKAGASIIIAYQNKNGKTEVSMKSVRAAKK